MLQAFRPRGKTMPKSYRQVALIIETSNAYSRGLVSGIRAYAAKHGPWSVTLGERGRLESEQTIPENWHGDGLIARIENHATADLVTRMNVPAVDVSAARLLPDIPWVETDDEAITSLAIEHLRSCGLKNLAYLGDARFGWSRTRETSFREQLSLPPDTSLVYTLSRHAGPGAFRWHEHEQDLASWLQKLPKPVGIFACYDICGQKLLEICRRSGIAVPTDCAVIGVDNDELICQIATPPLSSVIPNARKTGYIAAALLHRLMSDEPVSNRKHAIRPIGVQTRASTGGVAVDDPHVASALEYLHSNSHLPLSVDSVVEQVPVSRRTLENRFRSARGRTIHDEITLCRTDRVRDLLASTQFSVFEIAEQLSFANPEYMSVLFKRRFGTSPSRFRKDILVD